MLGKLMKYELKATSRLLVPLYLLLLLMSVINRLIFLPSGQAGHFRPIDQFLLIAFVMTIVAVMLLTVIYMISRFYKNLLTDEGYLMFTLPAKAHQLIDSKLLITVFWSVLSIIVVLISLSIAFAAHDTIPVAINGIKDTLANINAEFGGSLTLLFVEFLIAALLGMVNNILLIYVSIAIGQLFSRHKIIASFGAYMVIHMAIQFLMAMAAVPFAAMAVPPPPYLIMPSIIVILIVGCAGFYIGTNYIFKRKLNLD